MYAPFPSDPESLPSIWVSSCLLSAVVSSFPFATDFIPLVAVQGKQTTVQWHANPHSHTCTCMLTQRDREEERDRERERYSEIHAYTPFLRGSIFLAVVSACLFSAVVSSHLFSAVLFSAVLFLAVVSSCLFSAVVSSFLFATDFTPLVAVEGKQTTV